jgi:hypothetical protein
MDWTKEKISKIKSNPNNPRVIKDEKFEKLVKSIKEFPKMLEIRPIVVNDDMIVLGGNMRLKACKEAGLKEVPVIKASDLTEEEQRQFIIKDNVGFGQWEWDMLANEWDVEQLEDWGVEVFKNTLEENYFDIEADKVEETNTPSATDDDYSVFELVMLHKNKLILIETLTKIKNNFMFEKQEEALMELVRIYNKN